MLASAENYYRARQALSVLGLREGRKAWDQLDYSDINGSWEKLSLALAVILAAFQTRAATDGAAYVAASLTEQSIDAPIDGGAKVVPSAFANIASDGRSLTGLLEQPKFTTFGARKDGASFPDAVARGRAALDRIVVTQIQDAGRVAVGVSIAARPKVGGYVRMLNPPSCSRCILLAGKFYKFNAGFRRHPLCDCVHVPVAANTVDAPSPVSTGAVDPMTAFRNMTAAEQDKAFTKAGAQAIRDGANMGRVVNARSGMSTAGGYNGGYKVTDVLSKPGGPPRLMPETIYQVAGDNRAYAIDLLSQHGYVL